MVLRARFNEVVVGLPRERMRMVVVDGAIAIVDAQAISQTSWQRVLQSLNTFASSLHVVAGVPEPVYDAPRPAVGRAIAGLYMGFARKYMTDLNHPGSGYYTNALLYYRSRRTAVFTGITTRSTCPAVIRRGSISPPLSVPIR